MELLATVNGIDLALFVGGVLFGVYAWTRPKKTQISVTDIRAVMAELDKAVKTAQKEKGDN
jgi:hypothetical protein